MRSFQHLCNETYGKIKILNTQIFKYKSTFLYVAQSVFSSTTVTDVKDPFKKILCSFKDLFPKFILIAPYNSYILLINLGKYTAH